MRGSIAVIDLMFGLFFRTANSTVIVWLSTVFSAFMGLFNVLHQPLCLSFVAWSFWAVAAAAAFLIVSRARALVAVALQRAGLHREVMFPAES